MSAASSEKALALRGGRLEPVDDAAAALRDGAELVWLLLHDPSHEAVGDAVERLGLPHGLMADAAREHSRPRLLEPQGGGRAVVLLPAAYDDPDEEVHVGTTTVVVGERAVLSVSHGCPLDVGHVQAALGGRGGAGDLLTAVLKVVVLDYDRVLEGLDEDVRQVERDVFGESRVSQASRVYRLTRQVLELQRAVEPLVEVVADLGCPKALRQRVLRVSDHVDRLQSLLNSVFQADLSQVSVRQIEDQRRIAAWAAIGLVPTVVGAVYGMNFEHMPELRWQLGYLFAMLLITAVCTGLYVTFRRNGWLGPR